MADDNVDRNALVQLAEIKGDIKLILAGQERTNADITDIRMTIRGHGDRLGLLESKENQLFGERKGASSAGKLVWTIITALGGGVVAIAALVLTRL